MSERKEKFMPGPWYIKPREAYVTCFGIAYSRTTILDKPDGQYSPRHVIAQIARGNGREEANAALKKTSPKMYAMLEEAYGTFNDMADDCYASGNIESTEFFREKANMIYKVLKEARGEE